MADCAKCVSADSCERVWKGMEHAVCVSYLPKKTNADIIRRMSDEELGEWIANIHCPHCDEDDYPCDSCAEYWTEWMKQEANDGSIP